jgi:hypothetical protein
MRVLEGLEGAAGEAQGGFDRQAMEQLLAGLDSRVFLLNNVHEDKPQLFQTRWTLSYLRGPITRDQIRSLMRERMGERQSPHAAAVDSKEAVANSQKTAPAPSAETAPVLPPDIPCYYLPARNTEAVVYKPVLLGAAKVRYLDEKRKIDEMRELVFTTPVRDGAVNIDWGQAKAEEISVDELENEPDANAQFAELPAVAAKAKNYAVWNKGFAAWLFQTQQLTLMQSPSLGQLSAAGESERDFRIRLQQRAREERDRLAEALKQKYAPKLAALAERKRRAELAAEQQKSQQTQAFLQTAVSVGAGLLGAFLGRKAISATTVSRATTAARQAGRSWKEMQDVGQATETVEQIAQQAADLQRQFEEELGAQQAKVDPMTEQFEAVTIRPKKTNISVQLAALAWKPFQSEP